MLTKAEIKNALKRFLGDIKKLFSPTRTVDHPPLPPAQTSVCHRPVLG